MKEQVFDRWLQEQLASDVQSADDFTARVMARVAATPQETVRPTNDRRKLRRMMTALAACAAIVILIPVGMMMQPMEKAPAAADSAAMESYVMDDAAADMDYFVAENSNGAADDVEMKTTEWNDAAGAPTESVVTDSGGTTQSDTEAEAYQTMVHLVGDEAVQARAILAEMGCACEPMENREEVYHLTAAEAATLCQKLPGVIGAEGPLYLTLTIG